MRRIDTPQTRNDGFDATMDGIAMPEAVLLPEDDIDRQMLSVILRRWLADVQVYVDMEPVAGSWKLSGDYDDAGWVTAVRYAAGQARATVHVRALSINGELTGEIDRGGHDGRSLMGHSPHQPSVYV